MIIFIHTWKQGKSKQENSAQEEGYYLVRVLWEISQKNIYQEIEIHRSGISFL